MNRYEGRIFEVFIRAAKAGGCMAAQTETIGKLISRQAQYGVDVEPLVKYLMGTSCHERIEDGAQSCTDAVAIALARDLAREAKAQPELPELDEEAVKLCESDNLHYPSDPPQLKCRNCGRFYYIADGPPECLVDSEESQE